MMLNIFKTLFSVLGGTAGLILRFMLIIALCVIGVFCLGSMLFEAFIWGGVIRLAIGAACGYLVYLMVRAKKDE